MVLRTATGTVGIQEPIKDMMGGVRVMTSIIRVTVQRNQILIDLEILPAMMYRNLVLCVLQWNQFRWELKCTILAMREIHYLFDCFQIQRAI